MRLGLAALVAVTGCSSPDDPQTAEAKVFMERLAKGARIAYVTQGRLPIVDTGLVPDVDCCTQPDHECAPDPRAWIIEPWLSMDVAVNVPHRFRYAVKSDGETLIARAVGDLDCDGQTITYSLRAWRKPDGDLWVSAIQPPANAD